MTTSIRHLYLSPFRAFALSRSQSSAPGSQRTSWGPEQHSSPRLSALAAALLAAALALGGLTPARAEEPLWGEIASTLGKGFVNVTTRGSYSDTKPFRHHGGAVLLTSERMDVGGAIEYGLQSNLDLHLRLPYVSQTYAEQFAGQTARHSVSGLGEMELGGKWRFWGAMDDRHKDELALIAGVKLPTGDDNLRDPTGSIIPRHLQPNSGNPGARLGLAADRHTRRGGLWLSGLWSGEIASTSYQRGEMLQLHASVGRRLGLLTRADQTDWMGIVGLHYHSMGKDVEGGQVVADSGGSVLSVELGLVGSKRIGGARLGILIPLHTNLGLAHPPPRREIQGLIRASF